MPLLARRIALAVLALEVCAVAAAQAHDGGGSERIMMAQRTPSPPALDGRLTGEAWALAPSYDSFTQLWPVEGAPPSQRTEVRFLYDDDALYVGITMHDDQPDRIVSRMTRRDRDVESDWISVELDTRHDHTSCYLFRLNAAGVQSDGACRDDTSLDMEWDGVWNGAVARSAAGWTAVMRIPFSLLRFTARDEHVFGLQVTRYVSRTRERTVSAFAPSTVLGHVSKFGHLDGIRGLATERTFEARPFSLVRVRTRSERGSTFFTLGSADDYAIDRDLGVDLKLGVTSGLTLDASVNPDFGQIEADQVVLNLTRFETFFPEKRPFFIEGAEVFGSPIQVFYPRRIGAPRQNVAVGDSLIDAGGNELLVRESPGVVPILAAGKLVGTVSDQVSIGVLDAVTGAHEAGAVDDVGRTSSLLLMPPTNYALARARWSPGNASYVGATFSAVHRLGDHAYAARLDHDALAQSIDGQWQSDTGGIRVTGQAVVSQQLGVNARETPDGRPCFERSADCLVISRPDGTPWADTASGYGAQVKASQEAEHLLWDASVKTYSPGLELSGLGFLNEFNQHIVEAGLGYRDNRGQGLVRKTKFRVGSRTVIDYDGVPIRSFNGFDLDLEYANAITQALSLGISLPRTWNPHETGDGGRFERNAQLGVYAGADSDPRRKLVASALFIGTFDLGDNAVKIDSSLSLSFNLLRDLQLQLVPELGVETGMRFYSCTDPAGAACTAEAMERNYLFARLDSGYLSLIGRFTYALSRHFTVQGYAQLFSAHAAWSRYRELLAFGAHPDLYRDDFGPSAYDGDGDGDGIKDDDFQQSSLNVNLVVRWEFQPGSTLAGVYTRERSGSYDLAGRAPGFDVGRLAGGPTEDVFMLKLTYFMR